MAEVRDKKVDRMRIVHVLLWARRIIHCSHNGPEDDCEYVICRELTELADGVGLWRD